MAIVRFILAFIMAIFVVIWVGIRILTETLIQSTPLTRTDIRIIKVLILLLIVGLAICFKLI